MIVQCDQCNAKFRLDDSKVKDGGAKVRCSKCKHIFIVQREMANDEADFDSLLKGLVPPTPEAPKEPIEAANPKAEQFAAEAGESSENEIPVTGERAAGEVSTEKADFEFEGFAFDTGATDTPPAAPDRAEETGGSDFGELNLEAGDFAGEKVAAPEREVASFDADAFSFAEEPPLLASDKQAAAESEIPSFDIDTFSFSEEQNQPVPDNETRTGGLAASQVSGEPLASRAPLPPEQKEDLFAVPALDFSFDPGGEEQAASPSNLNTAKSAAQPPAFEFGEFEFGDAIPAEKPGEKGGVPAEQQGWAEEKPGPVSQETTSAFPISELSEEYDLPPAAIASRRRSGSFMPIAVTAISVLLVLVFAGGGFYYFKEGPAALNKFGLGFMAKWFGPEAKEEGVTVRNTVAAFLNNKEAGEIFAINGEVFNKFTKPRASIQVKATVYGPKGEVLQQKTAYCGNALSREQLMTLPVAEIEKTMGNPFGDSLSNLSVQPGKGIPFVVVFTNVPKGAADFGIEVVGSTLASK